MEQHAPFIRSLDGVTDAAVYTASHADPATVLEHAASLLSASGEESIRVRLGSRAILAEYHAGKIVAVEHPLSHPVGKSIHRALRRLAKRREPRRPLDVSPAQWAATRAAQDPEAEAQS